MEIIHLQNLLVRELTADEKAFVKEIDAAVALLEDEDSPGLIEFGGLKIPPEPEEEPDEVIYVSPPLTPLPDGNTANVTVETKDYTDGSSATGVAPLPDHSPEGAPEVPKSDAESASQPSAAENPPSE
jgi:hypothetical protein